MISSFHPHPCSPALEEKEVEEDVAFSDHKNPYEWMSDFRTHLYVTAAHTLTLQRNVKCVNLFGIIKC